MEQCQGELIFLLVVAVPTLFTVVALILKHSSGIVIISDRAPVNYWGSYSDVEPVANLKGVELPATPYEYVESTAHIQAITVHP